MQTLGQLPPEKGTQRCGLVGGSCKSSVGTAVGKRTPSWKEPMYRMTLHCAILFPENTSIWIHYHSLILHEWALHFENLKIERASTFHVAFHPIPWTLSCPGTIFRIKASLRSKAILSSTSSTRSWTSVMKRMPSPGEKMKSGSPRSYSLEPWWQGGNWGLQLVILGYFLALWPMESCLWLMWFL